MAQGNYLPGTYSRVGTEENPGTYLGGGSGGTSQTMPSKVKKVSEGTQICIKHNNKFCEFTNIPETIGTVSVNKKILTMKEKNEYLGFECQKDLGVQKVDLKGIYQVYVLDADGSVEQEIVFECK